MALFGLFSPPDIEKLQAKGNVKGLIKALRNAFYTGRNAWKSSDLRSSAAKALGELGDHCCKGHYGEGFTLCL
jgi:hypothetical protein